MPIIGSAHIDIRALDKNFRRDIENAVKKIKDIGIDVTVGADISAAQKKIDSLNDISVKAKIDVDDSALKNTLDDAAKNIKPVEVPVQADPTEFKQSIDETVRDIESDPVKVPVKGDVRARDLKRDIADAIRDLKIDIPAKLLDTQLMQSLRRLQLEADRLGKLKIGVDINEDEFEEQYEDIIERLTETVHEVRVTADANTAKAEAQLSLLTRIRKVPVIIDMQKSGTNALKGMTEALAGLVPPRQVADSIENILSNFTELTTKMTTTAAKFGVLATAATAAGGSILTISSDIGNLVGLLALAPAGMTAMYMATKTLGKAFEGFSAAVSEGGPAIEKLVPAARGAASAMHEVVGAMNARIKTNFWTEASDSMIKFARVVMPEFSSSMQTVASNFGASFAGMLDTIRGFEIEGQGVSKSLDEIVLGLGHMGDAVAPVTQALLILGKEGAPYIHELGSAIADAGDGFLRFIEKAEQTGQISVWIDEGISALQNLASVVGSTVTIFGNLAEAARNAGFGGLQALADGLSNVADASGDALVMERLESVFRGAGEGAERLAEGLGVIGDTIMESSDGISRFLELAGEIGKVSFENLDVLLNADGFGEGIMRALEGFRNGLDAATPGFEALGRIIGNLGQIAGTLFETMAPGFNNLMITIDKVVAGIRDGFIAAMPVVNQFVDMIMQLARGPLVLAANIVGKLLELFAMLPAPIQNTVLAVVALSTALKTLGLAGGALGLLGGGFDKLGGKAGTSTGMVSKLAAGLGLLAGAGAGAGRAASAVADSNDRIGNSAGRATGRLSGLGSVLGGLAGGLVGIGGGARTATSSVDSVGGAAGKATSKFGGLATGALTLARGFGPIGLAVTGITAAFSVYEQTAGNTAARTQELSTALSQYGSGSDAANSATQNLLTTHRGFSESVVGLIPNMLGLSDGSTLATRGFEDLGWSVEEVSAAISSSGGQWTDQRQKIEDLISSTGMFSTVSEETSQAVLGTNEAVGMTGEQLRAMRTAMDDANRSVEEHTNSQIKAQEAAQKTADFNRQVAEAVSTNKSAVIEAAGAYDVLASASTSVQDKMSAFQTTLSYVNSMQEDSRLKTMSDTQAKMANAQATATLSSSIEQVSGSYGHLGEQVITAKGAFVETTQVGRDFYGQMQNIATQIQEVGVRTYDTALKNGDSITVAADKAVASMKPMTDQVRTMLQGMGITGEAEINKVLSALGLLPEDVKLALNAEGNAADVARETKLIVEGLTSGNYDMAIGAVNEQAMGVIADTVGAGDEFAAGDYEAVFKALAEEYGVTEAVELLEGTAGKDFESIMKLYADDFASDKIDGALEKAGHLDGKSVEAQLSAVDDLTPEVEKSLDVLAEVDGKSAEARLDAINNLSDEAKTALGDLLGVDGKNAQAVMDAIDNLSPKVREALGLTDEANGKTATIHMDALDDASPKVVGAIDAALQFDGKKVTTTLDALDNLSPQAREALAEVLGVEGTSGTALLEAVNNLSPQAQAALGDLAGIDGVTSTAVLDAIDNASPMTEHAIGGITSLDGKTGTARLEALDNASQTSREALAEVLGINSAEGTALLSAIDKLSPDAQKALNEMMKVDGQQAVADIMANDQASGQVQTAGFNLDAFMNKDANKDVTATDNASPYLQQAIGKIGEWLGIPADKSITAQDNASGTVTGAITTIGTFLGIPAAKTITATDNASGIINGAKTAITNFAAVPASKIITAVNQTAGAVGAAQATMGGLRDVARNLIAKNITGPVVGIAQGTMNGLRDVSRNLNAKNMTIAAKAQAQSTLNSLRDVSRNLNAKNMTAAAKAQAQSTLNSLRDVSRNLNAKNMTAGIKAQAQSTMDSLRDVTRDLRARNLVGEAVSAAQGLMNSLRDKVVNITSIFRRRDENANGGIYTGQGMAAYANGGILKAEAFANGGVKLPSNISSFAGGSENHVAQISRGKWPVRIWSEPETGGEAYIPLGVNKRPRSLDILKKVAEMFGFSLVKKFADGGILKGLPTSKTGHFADGGFNNARDVSGYVTRNSRAEATGITSTGNVVYSPVMNVYPSSQLSEEQVAESVSRDLFWKIINH